MGSHDDYGKKLLMQAAGEDFEQYGSSIEIDYGAGQPARIDGTVGTSIAIEIESRTAKQVRGAVLDLICHPYPKKLLILVPKHMQNPAATADQCVNIMRRFCSKDNFRVVVLKGTGDDHQFRSDTAIVKKAIKELSD